MKKRLLAFILVVWIGLIWLPVNGEAQTLGDPTPRGTNPEYLPLQEATPEKLIEMLKSPLGLPKGRRPEKPCEVYRSREDTGTRPSPGTRIPAVPLPFALNKAEPMVEGQRILDNVGAALKSYELEPFCIRVEGYTDSRGNAAYNKKLSDRRAQSVVNYLLKIGVKEDRLLPIGYGKEQPLCKESTESCWQKNRRVQFVNLGYGSE